MKKLSKFLMLLVLFNLVNINYVFGASYLYKVKENSTKVESSIATVAPPSFTFESHSQLLMDATTGEILYSNNENEKMLPASVTKIMTLLLVMEQIDSGALKYDDMLTCSKAASQMGGSQIWFKEGEQISIDDALKAVCVVSANDVTYAFAERVGGSIENFVSMMNAKAEELGLENTHFANPHGIDEDGHYMSAKDIAIIAKELITKHPNILKYTSIWMDTLRNGEFGLTNTNKLIRFYDGATGLKTGYTSNALYNLVATATRGDTTFIAVAMKAPSSDIRNAEIRTLLDYAFSNYETKKICSSNAILDEFEINKNIGTKLETRIEKDIYRLVNKGSKLETEQKIIYNDNLMATVEENAVVGKIEVYDKETGEKLGESNIVSNNSVPRSNINDYIVYVMNKFFLI